mmetsp:Transcript_113276/g.353093  ORF Transcript_113276/g.353093 Transcript_113276/m.353093 type:complete len:88 (+) Transcript_113276:70-333(+)
MRFFALAAFALLFGLGASDCVGDQCSAVPSAVEGASMLTRKAVKKKKRAVMLTEDAGEAKACQSWCSTVPPETWRAAHASECGGCPA